MILQRTIFVLALYIFSAFGIYGQSSEVFATPGTYTWTVPPCVYEITVEAWGGGGGGGAVWSRFSPTHNGSPSAEACTAAGGGGGGGFAKRTYLVTPGQVYTIVVGAGGAGGTVNNSLSSNRAQNGSDGGNSSFSGPATAGPGTLTAFGGDGGFAANFLRSNCNGGCWINHEGVNGNGGSGGGGANGTTMYTGGNGAAGVHSGSTNDRSGAGGGGAGNSANGGNATSTTNGGSGGSASGGNGANGIVQPYGSGYLGTNGNNGNTLGGGGGGACGHNRQASSSTHRSNIGGNGARGEVRIFYTMPALPEPSFNQVPAICAGEILNPLPTTSNNGFIGSWSPTLNNSTTTTYIFTPDPNGPCADTASMTIVVNQPVLPLFDPIPSICAGDVLPPISTISNNGITGVWSPAPNNTVTTNYIFTPTSGQCANSTDLTIDVNPIPVISNQPQNTAICANGSATLEVNADTGPFQWQYFNGALWENVTDGSPVGFTYTNTNSSSLDINAVNSNCDIPNEYRVVIGQQGCQLISDIASVTVVRASRIAPTGPQCSGTELNFEACPSGAVYQWNVSPPNGTTASPLSGNGEFFSFIPENTTGLNQQFPVQVEVNLYGVSCTQMFNPTIFSPPNAGIDGFIQDCSGSVPTEAQLFSALNGQPDQGGVWTNNGNIYTYTVVGNGMCPPDLATVEVITNSAVPEFDPVGGICQGDVLNPIPTTSLNGIVGSWTPSWNNMSTTTYTFIPDPGECAVSTTVTIDVNAPIIPSFDPVASICQNDASPVLNTTSNNGIIGSWSPMVNTSVSGVQTFTFTPDTGQCAEEALMDIVIHPVPSVNAGADIEVCEGELVTLFGQGAYLYDWSDNILDGIPFIPQLGINVYSVVGTNSEGCFAEDEIIVTVYSNPIVTAGSDIEICEGEIITLSGSGANSYFWSGNIVDNIPFEPLPGYNEYEVTGTDLNGCIGTDQVSVVVNELPDPNINFNAEGCAPALVTLFSATSGSETCNWLIQGIGDFNGCDSVSFYIEEPGCYDVTLTASQNGCSTDLTAYDLICVDAYPEADFNMSSSSVSSLNSEVIFENLSVDAVYFEWDFGDGSALSNFSDPTHNYPDSHSGIYQVLLIAYSANGCSDTSIAFVNVTEELIFYVPNTFTPDGDIYNQVFEPVFTSGFDPYDYHLLIFNRWGEVVFESFDHEVGWDGSYGSNNSSGIFNCPDGTYTWRIEFGSTSNDERYVEVGHVSLLR